MELVVGRIGRAHGLRGEVTVAPHTDDPGSRLAEGSMLMTDPLAAGPLTVAGARWHNGRLLVTFEEAADRLAAERLRGTVLLVDVDPEQRPDDPEEFYDHQLVGLSVVTTAGTRLGVLAEVLHLPAQDVLAIRGEDGREVLVPFVAALVPEVDLAGRRVVVDPPPGLLDLDSRG